MNINKNNARSYCGISAVCLILVLAFLCSSATAEVNYVLMLQQTPVDGGTVSPEAGVHNISANGDVTVVARPRPGYQFVSWLGDVSDPTSNSTTVSVNAPKIVVAVFQRSEYELPFEKPAAPDSEGGGGGSLIPSRQYTGGPAGVSPAIGHASYVGPKYTVNQPGQPSQPPADNSRNDPPPVPNGDSPVPEPATMLILGIGSMLILNKRK